MNLSATSATPGDVGALRLLHQWGRKDPFMGPLALRRTPQHRQPPPSDADSSVIAFLDSYEVRFMVRRRTRGADGRRHLRRNKRK